MSTQLQLTVADSAVSILLPPPGYSSAYGPGGLQTTPRALLTGRAEKSIGILMIIEKQDITGLQSRASASSVSIPPGVKSPRGDRVQAGCTLAI